MAEKGAVGEDGLPNGVQVCEVMPTEVEERRWQGSDGGMMTTCSYEVKMWTKEEGQFLKHPGKHRFSHTGQQATYERVTPGRYLLVSPFSIEGERVGMRPKGNPKLVKLVM